MTASTPLKEEGGQASYDPLTSKFLREIMTMSKRRWLIKWKLNIKIVEIVTLAGLICGGIAGFWAVLVTFGLIAALFLVLMIATMMFWAWLKR